MLTKRILAVIAAALVLALPCFVQADPAVSTEEAKGLANKLLEMIKAQDIAGAEKLLDVDALFDRLSVGINLPADQKAGVKQGFARSVVQAMDTIVKEGAQDSYHLLRVKQVNGETHLLFRLAPKTGGLNYNEWLVGKDAEGEIRFQDAYIAVTGEWLSQTMHRLALQMISASNSGFLSRLTGKDKQIAANNSTLVQMIQSSRSGNTRQVINLYKTLPTSMQEEKFCMILRLGATTKLQNELPNEYSAAVADYKRLFPGDPSVDIDCLDALLNAKQFAEARQSLDRINTFVGGDPFLLVVRGNTYEAEGGEANYAKAKECFQKAVAHEPTLRNAYWSLVTLSLKTKQYDQTAEVLTELQQKFHVKINDLTTIPLYADFVKSEEYKKWMASQTPGAAHAQEQSPQ